MNVKLWLSNGHFTSDISIPLNSTEHERKEFVDAWFAMMEAAVKVGSKRREQKANEQTAADTGSGGQGKV